MKKYIRSSAQSVDNVVAENTKYDSFDEFYRDRWDIFFPTEELWPKLEAIDGNMAEARQIIKDCIYDEDTLAYEYLDELGIATPEVLDRLVQQGVDEVKNFYEDRGYTYDSDEDVYRYLDYGVADMKRICKNLRRI